MLFAVVWHYWIGFVLAASSVFLVIAMVVGYLTKVQNLKYKKK